MSSTYFRDRAQGPGAIAANARAPRAAPAPTIRRAIGYVPTGKMRIDDDGGDSGGGGGPAPVPGTPFNMPPRTGTKTSGRAPARTPAAIPRPKVAPSPKVMPLQTSNAALNQMVALLPPAPAATVAPTTSTTSAPPKTSTIIGGGGGGMTAAPKAGSSLSPLTQLPGDDEVVESAMTAVAPEGAGKVFLVLALGGTAAYLAYRHFSKRKGRR